MQPTDVKSIRGALAVHGAAPNAKHQLNLERQAAEESHQSGVYVSWVPHPSCILGPSAADELKNGTGQCCRVGSSSVCICGHGLHAHKPILKLKSGYNKPPGCSACKRCTGFQYTPQFPEECGQWWLCRRRDFNIIDWRKRVRETPSEYCCIGCEQKVSDHETLFENRSTRISRGAAVDEAYMPLSDHNITAPVSVPGEGEEQDDHAADMAGIRNTLRNQELSENALNRRPINPMRRLPPTGASSSAAAVGASRNLATSMTKK